MKYSGEFDAECKIYRIYLKDLQPKVIIQKTGADTQSYIYGKVVPQDMESIFSSPKIESKNPDPNSAISYSAYESLPAFFTSFETNPLEAFKPPLQLIKLTVKGCISPENVTINGDLALEQIRVILPPQSLNVIIFFLSVFSKVMPVLMSLKGDSALFSSNATTTITDKKKKTAEDNNANSPIASNIDKVASQLSDDKNSNSLSMPSSEHSTIAAQQPTAQHKNREIKVKAEFKGIEASIPVSQSQGSAYKIFSVFIVGDVTLSMKEVYIVEAIIYEETKSITAGLNLANFGVRVDDKVKKEAYPLIAGSGLSSQVAINSEATKEQKSLSINASAKLASCDAFIGAKDTEHLLSSINNYDEFIKHINDGKYLEKIAGFRAQNKMPNNEITTNPQALLLSQSKKTLIKAVLDLDRFRAMIIDDEKSYPICKCKILNLNGKFDNEKAEQLNKDSLSVSAAFEEFSIELEAPINKTDEKFKKFIEEFKGKGIPYSPILTFGLNKFSAIAQRRLQEKEETLEAKIELGNIFIKDEQICPKMELEKCVGYEKLLKEELQVRKIN